MLFPYIIWRYTKMIYLSGKITNNPNYVEQFTKAENLIKSIFPNKSIFNPVSYNKEFLPEFTRWCDYMRLDIEQLTKSNMIVMLPNWWKSKGARIEWLLAKFVFDIEIWYLDKNIESIKGF